MRERKYQKGLTKYGLTPIIINGKKRLQYAIHCEVLANKLFQGKLINMTLKTKHRSLFWQGGQHCKENQT
jgi:hypothetical protein